jgi:hypothetical protein
VTNQYYICLSFLNEQVNSLRSKLEINLQFEAEAVAVLVFQTPPKKDIVFVKHIPGIVVLKVSHSHCSSTSSYESDPEASGRSRKHKRSSRSRKVLVL